MASSAHGLVVAPLIWVLLASNALAARIFIDVPQDHWAANAVRFAAVEHGFMQAHSDGSFRGDDPFTRVQLAIALKRLLESLEAQSHSSWSTPGDTHYAFEDLPIDRETRTAALDVANRYHLFDGMPGVFPTTLGADRRVTRYEMATAVDHLLRLGESHGVIDPSVLPDRPVVLKDVPPDALAAQEVREVAERYQVMVGFPDGTFRGSQELTRFQFAAAAAQTFPQVKDLVALTRERRIRRRFQEDMPFHFALASRLDGQPNAFAGLRYIGYSGAAFLLARSHIGMPIAAIDHLSEVELAGGMALTPGSALAFEPYLGGRLAVTGGATWTGLSVGAIGSWNPDPFQLWLDAAGTQPLGESSPIIGGATLGVGYTLTSHSAITFELGLASLPVAPTSSGAGFSSEGAVLTQVGLAFGF